MRYQSTRGGEKGTSFPDMVFGGYAKDGGLYVPETIPTISKQTLQSWSSLKYPQLCSEILALFVDNETLPHLPLICRKALSNFDTNEMIPTTILGNIHVLELFHGPTLAFKDVGLNILAQIMAVLLTKRNERSQNRNDPKLKANVLIETTGDTGPAAVAAVINIDCKYLNIFCVFPYKYVTSVQARQLTTAVPLSASKYDNVRIYSSDCTADENCLILKQIFAKSDFADKYNLCAMNSINFIRIIAQMTYYFYAYLKLFPLCDGYIDVSIPAGAFGNSAAAAFAKYMQLPIRYIIACPNENDIVHRTLSYGDFSCDFADYRKTNAPAMDIQIPYNIERYFWLVFDRNCSLIKEIMDEFEYKNMKDANVVCFEYQFNQSLQSKLHRLVHKTYRSTDREIKNTINSVFHEYGYVLCPHSACAMNGALKFMNEHEYKYDYASVKVPMIVIATAHAAKFPNIIQNCIELNEGDTSKRQILGEKLQHEFLPADDAKEEYTSLKSIGDGFSENWVERWQEIIQNDIKSLSDANESLLAKL